MFASLEKCWHSKFIGTSIHVGKSVWGWTRERLWPVYSAAVVVSLFQMIAVASEKQIVADHYFGDVEGKFSEQQEDLVRDARKYFNEEVSVAVKEHVWQLPPAAFRREYSRRLESA